MVRCLSPKQIGGVGGENKDFEKDLDNCKHPGHLGELVTKKKDWLDKLPEGDKNKARNLYTQREDQMRSLKEGKFLNE